MKFVHQKLFAIILVLTIIVSIFLWKEIKDALSFTTKSVDEPAVSTEPVPIKISSSDLILGNPGAPLTVVEFLNLGDEKGRAVHLEISKFVKDHPKEVRLVFKDAPVQKLFKNPLPAHKTAHCAAEQDKIWIFLENLINENSVRQSKINLATQKSGLNESALQNCLLKKSIEDLIQINTSEAIALQLGEPPLLFVNNRKVNLNQGINLTQLLQVLISK